MQPHTHCFHDIAWGLTEAPVTHGESLPKRPDGTKEGWYEYAGAYLERCCHCGGEQWVYRWTEPKTGTQARLA